MPTRRVFVVLLPLAAVSSSAQDMVLSNGQMHVAAGTTVVIDGSITWQIPTGALVINDGLIDLGSQTNVMESDGSPITGAGTETAIWAPTGPLVNAQPGNLGLAITSAYANGDLLVRRGHLPTVATNGTPSIARWFAITTPQPTMEDMDVVLHYDLTELNGALPSSLAVFEAPAYSGTWTPLVTTNNIPAQTLTATDQSPTAYLTAFDFDAATQIIDASADDDVRVWPTVVSDAVNVTVPAGRVVSRVDLIDASGRVVWAPAITNPAATLNLAVPSISKGTYMLRVNGTSTGHRLIKQ